MTPTSPPTIYMEQVSIFRKARQRTVCTISCDHCSDPRWPQVPSLSLSQKPLSAQTQLAPFKHGSKFSPHGMIFWAHVHLQALLKGSWLDCWCPTFIYCLPHLHVIFLFLLLLALKNHVNKATRNVWTCVAYSHLDPRLSGEIPIVYLNHLTFATEKNTNLQFPSFYFAFLLMSCWPIYISLIY